MKTIKKLGEGAFADVFLVHFNGKNAALKVAKNNISKSDAERYSKNEISILNNFKKSNHIVNLIFYEITHNKNHIIVELLGDELYSVLDLYKENGKLLPLKIVKRFTRQLLEGMQEMAECNILHNDLKPENILFTKPLGNLFKCSKSHIAKLIMRYSGKNLQTHLENYYYVLQELVLSSACVKISDFGNAYSINSIDKHFESARPTRHYISPEILLKCPYWIESDMWSLGCIIVEMMMGEILFDPIRDNNMGINSAHLAAIIQIFGEFNECHLRNSKKKDKYFIGTKHRFNYLIKKKPLEKIVQYYGLSQAEADFLRPFFNFDAQQRITPAECLKSQWLL
jgi:serine/threonine protein kinase